MKHSELSEEARFKANARAYANVYLKRGKIARGPCAKCGSDKAEMHHDDYSKPLEIRWLCRFCHIGEHGGAVNPAKHGSGNCAKCSNVKILGSAYCRDHHNAYKREWNAKRSKLFKELLETSRHHQEQAA